MGAFFGAFAISSGGGGGGSGGFAGALIEAALAAGVTNDFDPGGAPAWPGTSTAPYGRLFLALAGDASLGGLLGGLDGQQLEIVVSGGNLLLLNRSGGSAPANQFQASGDAFVGDGASINMIYTAGSHNKWYVAL